MTPSGLNHGVEYLNSG